jgi:myo-inositol-1(or 4)-monophosphatase
MSALDTAQERLRLAQRALEHAEAAGQLLAGYAERLGRLESRSKSAPRDLVTQADLDSERLLVERLRADFPEHAIEAEETVQDPAQEGRLRWFVDPLDGTVNLVHGLPFFCVSMGLYRGATPLCAARCAPLLGESFYAAAGAGAYLRRAGGEPHRLRVSGASSLSECVLATGFPYRRNELPNNNLGNFARLFYEVRGMRRMGSAALDLCYVAAGRLDAFWELHLSPHDVAAGALLVLEAGGVVSDLGGGGDWLRGGQIVAGPAALTALIRARVSARPERLLGGPRP